MSSSWRISYFNNFSVEKALYYIILTCDQCPDIEYKVENGLIYVRGEWDERFV